MGAELKLGMHEVTNADYHGGEAISFTHLKELIKSPAHYQQWVNTPDEPTEEMQIGSAVHCKILEPHLFDGLYAVLPQFEAKTVTGEVAKNPWNTKEGKAFKAGFEAENAGKVILSAAQVERVNRCVDAVVKKVGSHETWGNLLAGDKEKAFYWKDPETGIHLRCKPDVLTKVGIITDLKTVESATENDFQRQVAKLMYHMQAAVYLDGVRLAHEQSGQKLYAPMPDLFVFVAVEKEGPHGVNVFPLGPNAISEGRRLYQKLLKVYAECVRTNTWPGYEKTWDLNRPLELPNWAYYAY